MKVTGEVIKALLEVETTVTVRKKLYDWGFADKGYIVTEELLSYHKEENSEEAFVSYTSYSLGSERL